MLLLVLDNMILSLCLEIIVMGIVMDATCAIAVVVGLLVALEQCAESQEGKAHSLNREDSRSNR
jgi:hypothetical protein